ncbi:MAG: HAD hydrolase family protein [Methylomonas sp.]|nr:HAD hydrolase family protein [Methylomonas sp.]PPD22064.1 MAG: hydrolase [Methylomonas sp.]PPD26156.1 MAG: hydrolase [Methylomonas sp.]PPD37871.1 MAG: hydrolase [Methylomonas sp.]PPD42448.1 MAG: hydrolase [Methylomonas sp.]
MQSLVFTDLDDTLFQTLRKCGDHALADLDPRAYLKDGSIISYATSKQNWLWQWINHQSHVIPVTARSFDALTRVDLPFQAEAILNHGAVILDKNRQINLEWHDYMTNLLPPYAEALADLWHAILAHTHQDSALKPRLIEDFGIDWYGVIKHADGDEAALDNLRQSVVMTHDTVTSGLLYCHFNGNNLAVLPKIIGKAYAVNYLIEYYGKHFDQFTTIGIGDSETDLPFMSLCDYAMVPKNTQLRAMFA